MKGDDMTIMNATMPTAAKRAFEDAHRRQARGAGIHKPAGKKQTTQHSYRLSADYKKYRRDEQEYRASRNTGRRADIRALEAKTFLLTQRTPRLTAKKPEISRIARTARKHSAARARNPKRVRAAQLRHMRTVTHSILKERGLK